jgi:hypothetical protein
MRIATAVSTLGPNTKYSQSAFCFSVTDTHLS